MGYLLMTFCQQLLLTIIDKLAIGFLILLAGYLFNRILETFKSQQAFQNEIAKQRVSKISEVWSELYSWTQSSARLFTERLNSKWN